MPSKRVLVVDDEPEVTFSLQAFLLSRGYEMLTALDGLQAMRLLRQQPVDLVLLDMKMPGVNGLEVLKFIRAECPSTRVVVVTAYDLQFQELVEQVGVDGFLMKPFGIQALTTTVEEVLAGKKVKPQRSAAPVEERHAVQPKARLLFLEPSEYTYQIKEVFFADPQQCDAHYEVAPAYSSEELIQQLEAFRPDILLVDVTMLNRASDLAIRVMGSLSRPKEMIIHGSGLVALSPNQDSKVHDLSRLGVKVVQNESFTRAGLLRLGEVIRQTALHQGLVQSAHGSP